MTTPYGAPMPAQLPEAPLSINFKVPEVPGAPMLTVRGSNGIELAGLTQDVALQGAQIGKALTDFRSGFLAGAGVQSEAPQAQPQQQYQAPASPAPQYQPQPQQYGAPAPDQGQYSMPAQPQYGAPAAPPQTGGTGPAPTCPHGQRIWRAGTSKSNGRPYKMWACPAPQGAGQCKPEYVN